MTSPARVEETTVYDRKNGKKTVRPSEEVAIMPADLRVETDRDEEYFAQKSVDRLQSHLGTGPYIIDHIGEWPCGRIMLYIATANGASGAYAADFMSVN